MTTEGIPNQHNSTPNECGGTTSGYDDFAFGNLLDPHFALGRGGKKSKRKTPLPGGGTVQSDEQDDPDEEMEGDPLEGDDITAEDLANIVKMTDYIER